MVDASKNPPLLGWLANNVKPAPVLPGLSLSTPVSAPLLDLTRKAHRHLMNLGTLVEKLPAFSEANSLESNPSTEQQKLYQALKSATLKLEALYQRQAASDDTEESPSPVNRNFSVHF